ncbi:MAG: methyltransferase domain-containing protein [Nitrospirae bacterium]|nr:methyltransferase domain-containing protein [Nitrospirota bacterium]
MIKVEYILFRTRSDRAEYIAKKFDNYLKGKIIDVGCDKALLRELLPEAEYIGIDIGGDPDIVLNLEQADKLPFDNSSFDCVICSDVLEHLNNFHIIFDELIRISKKYIIISLPNNWREARRVISRGKGSIVHYGLPSNPSKDRHKWFFSFSEALKFINSKLDFHPIKLVEAYAAEKSKIFPIRYIRRLRYPCQEHYLNRYAHTLWVVLEKATKKI